MQYAIETISGKDEEMALQRISPNELELGSRFVYRPMKHEQEKGMGMVVLGKTKRNEEIIRSNPKIINFTCSNVIFNE